MINRLCLAIVFYLPLAGVAAELKMHDAWVAAAPPNATTQAAYICFINDSDKDVEITGVSAKGFVMAMIHNTKKQGDMVMMEHLSALTVPAHKMVTLEPGSMHIMLMDSQITHVVGDLVPLTFHYKDGSEQTFTLEVKSTSVKHSEVNTGDKNNHQHP